SMFGSPLGSVKRSSDLCDQLAGHLVLALRRPRFDTFRSNEVNGIDVAAHNTTGGRDVIRNDPVAAFTGKLCPCIGDNLVGFGGKTDDEPRSPRLAMGDAREDVRILGERQTRRAIRLLFVLARAPSFGAP